MGPIYSPETSVSNHLTPRNNPEDGKIQTCTVFTSDIYCDTSVNVYDVFGRKIVFTVIMQANGGVEL